MKNHHALMSTSIQREYEAKGDWPKFKKSEWVQTGVAAMGIDVRV